MVTAASEASEAATRVTAPTDPSSRQSSKPTSKSNIPERTRPYDSPRRQRMMRYAQTLTAFDEELKTEKDEGKRKALKEKRKEVHSKMTGMIEKGNEGKELRANSASVSDADDEDETDYNSKRESRRSDASGSSDASTTSGSGRRARVVDDDGTDPSQAPRSDRPSRSDDAQSANTRASSKDSVPGSERSRSRSRSSNIPFREDPNGATTSPASDRPRRSAMKGGRDATDPSTQRSSSQPAPSRPAPSTPSPSAATKSVERSDPSRRTTSSEQPQKGTRPSSSRTKPSITGTTPSTRRDMTATSPSSAQSTTSEQTQIDRKCGAIYTDADGTEYSAGLSVFPDVEFDKSVKVRGEGPNPMQVTYSKTWVGQGQGQPLDGISGKSYEPSSNRTAPSNPLQNPWRPPTTSNEYSTPRGGYSHYPTDRRQPYYDPRSQYPQNQNYDPRLRSRSQMPRRPAQNNPRTNWSPYDRRPASSYGQPRDYPSTPAWSGQPDYGVNRRWQQPMNQPVPSY